MKLLYKNVIMDLYNDTSYREIQEQFTATCSHQNPLCGDLVTFYLKLDGTIVKNIRFSASGCILSQAAATFVCKKLEGKAFAIESLSDATIMQKSLGLTLGPSRLRCIMLPVECLKTLRA